MSERRENARMVGKLAIVALGMFAFGYALIPVYKRICEVRHLALSGARFRAMAKPATCWQLQVDTYHHRGIRCQFARPLGCQR
jgi:cytochrome c oxidase assembly protein subunit 11